MNIGQRLFIFLIRVYQLFFSPLKRLLFGSLGGCRFDPTCSEYARRAVSRHGVIKGLGLAARRLLRCHPWGACGYDPVPPAAGDPARQPPGREASGKDARLDATYACHCCPSSSQPH